MIRTYEYGTVSDKDIFARTSSSQDVSGIVAPIIADVRARGDQALRDYTRKFDGVEITGVEVPRTEIDAAHAAMDKAFIAVLEKAADNIRSYHSRQKRESFVISEREGIVLGQKIVPVAVAGIYVPGGTAAYPSTVLMDTIPAKIAGVGQVVMVTPPGNSKDSTEGE